jgi:ribosome biogenesis GTPase / thiamine phosphate phosphatase
MDGLRALGWTEFFEGGFAPFAAEECFPARVAVQMKGHYLLYAEEGECRGEVAGKIHYTAKGSEDFPVVGDWVVVKGKAKEGVGIISAILPRRTEFARKAAGDRSGKQVLTANVDVVFVVSGCDAEFNLKRLDRYLVIARSSGAEPVFILNKSDLAENSEELAAAIRRDAPGVQVLLTSAKSGQGLEQILAVLRPGTTGALLGSSGVGKSTIINHLLGVDRMRTQEVRTSDSRGRHTTTHRELVLLPNGGMLIDTPGLREIQLWDDEEGAKETFEDIEDLALQCRFTDCRHDNEPGCAIRKALEDGTLDGDRFESYLKLQRELAYHARKKDPQASLEEKKRWKKIHKDFKKWNKKK